MLLSMLHQPNVVIYKDMDHGVGHAWTRHGEVMEIHISTYYLLFYMECLLKKFERAPFNLLSYFLMGAESSSSKDTDIHTDKANCFVTTNAGFLFIVATHKQKQKKPVRFMMSEVRVSDVRCKG